MLKDKIFDKFNNYHIKISENQADIMQNFNNLMLEYNKLHNITNIIEEDDTLYKHYLDSALPIELFKDNTKIIDIGCGAGFPCIPLSILNNSLQITAVDSVGKKTNFVNTAKNTLNLDNLQVINSRIEDLAEKSDYRENYDYVISRAVAPLPTLLEYCAPFLKVNGYIICYKGSNYQNEIDISSNALKLLNCKIAEIKEYKIKELDTSRYVLVIQKLSTTSSKYPRKQNKPRLKPL